MTMTENVGLETPDMNSTADARTRVAQLDRGHAALAQRLAQSTASSGRVARTSFLRMNTGKRTVVLCADEPDVVKCELAGCSQDELLDLIIQLSQAIIRRN